MCVHNQTWLLLSTIISSQCSLRHRNHYEAEIAARGSTHLIVREMELNHFAVRWFFPFTIIKSCASQCIGKWQKPVSQNSYLTVFFSLFLIAIFQILAQLSPSENWLLGRKLTFYGGRVKDEGQFTSEKNKYNVHVEIPLYHLFSANPKLFLHIHLRL